MHQQVAMDQGMQAPSLGFLGGQGKLQVRPFGVGYPDRYPMQSIALVLFAAAVEVMQVWAPGRHPRLSDFAAAVLGLGLGTGLAFVSTRIARG